MGKALAVLQKCADANESAIGAIHSDGIGNKMIFGPVLAWGRMTVSLVPVEHESTVAALFDQKAVDLNFLAPLTDNPDACGLHGNPAGSRKTIFRRVDGVAFSLAGEKRNEEVVRLLPRDIEVIAKQEIARA